MALSPEILVDVHEGEGVARELGLLGCQVRHVSLAVGDYLLGSGIVVERKTVSDLHLSVIQGRLWQQLGRLRFSARRRYLLLEGHDLDDGPLTANSVRGVYLAIVDQGVPIVRSRDRVDSALWLSRLALRVERRRDRPVFDQRPPLSEDPAEAVLAAVPGISVVLARALLTEFGSVAAVVNASEAEWRRVHGIGPARAEALARAFAA